MSESSSISDVEVSPSTDSLDTLIGFATETGRTTAVSLSSSSAGPPASSDNALASSDSESRPVTPRQEEGNRTQNGHQGRVGRPAPPSGAHDEPAAAAASAATTGPGPGPGPRLPEPALDLLAMLNRMQQSQQKQQQQQQQFQQQQQEQQQQQQQQQFQQQQQQQDILAALMQQLLPARQQAGPRPGPGDSGSLPASPPSPPPTPQLRARDLSSLPAHPPFVGCVTPRGYTYVYTARHHPHGARSQRSAGGP